MPGDRDPLGAMAHIAAVLDEHSTDAMLADDAAAAFQGTKHDGEAVVEAAIAQGVLAQKRDGTVGFGIPSFQPFLLEKLRQRDARLQPQAAVAPRRL